MRRVNSVVSAVSAAVLLGWCIATSAAETKPQKPDLYADFGGANTPAQVEQIWQGISRQYFSERNIVEDDDQQIIALDVPGRAENDALVPLTIVTRAPDDPLVTIDKVYLSIDVNPAPMAGIFTLSAVRPLEQISTRVRVNGYTFVRAIAELSDGRLFMDKKWVKSRGAGCSAPPGMDQKTHQARLGNMRFRLSDGDLPSSPVNVQLMISHPNNTGMQRDQLSTLFIPPHYIKDVLVTFNSELIMQAETNFSISENPSFRFTFDQHESGELKAVARDTKNNEFVMTEIISN